MSGRDSRHEADLLAAEDPDGSNFGTVYQRHFDAVLAFFARQGVDAWTAADLTSETFAAALRHRRKYDPAMAPVRAWLLGIARNKLADSQRRRHRSQRLQRRLEMEPITLTAQDIEAYERLRQSLVEDGLTETQAFAVEQRVIHERSYPDLSRDMGLSEPAVRQHVSRGLRALRRLANDHRS